MAIPLSEATLLGVVQGIADVLPLSADGHFALAQVLFGGHAADPAAAAALHIGVLSATVVVLRKRARVAVVEGVRGILRPRLLKDTQGGRDAVVVALATIPTAVVGLSLKGLTFGGPTPATLLGGCFLASAVGIGSTYWAPSGDRPTPPHAGALLAGLAQGIAVLPGLSRSGVTIATLLWSGVAGERAFELSFLMWLPALAGAELLEARGAFHGAHGGLMLVYSACIAFVVGICTLELLRRLLIRRVVSVFAVYLFPLGLATLAWGYARP